jgi:hypothetical protein
VGALVGVFRRGLFGAAVAAATLVFVSTAVATTSAGPAGGAQAPRSLTSPPTVLASNWKPTTAQTVPGSTYYYNSGVSCVSSVFCMSAGTEYNGSGYVPLFQQWNGTAWATTPVSFTPVGYLETLGVSCVTTAFCVAVGFQLVMKGSSDVPFALEWNGSGWTSQTVPLPTGQTTAVLNAVSCLIATDCFADGYVGSGNSARALVEQWNGTQWTVVPVPDTANVYSELDGISCSLRTFCMAVGTYELSTPPNDDTVLVEVWNGTSWQMAPGNSSPGSTTNSYLQSVSCAGSGFCAATGDTYGTSGTSYRTLMEIWNGSAWSITPSTNFGTNGDYMYGVSCVSATSCSAVGSYYTDPSEDYFQNEAFTWNGTTWAAVTPADFAIPESLPGPEAGLGGVSCIADWACMAVGYASAASDSYFAWNIEAPMARSGYRFVASDGGVFNYGAGAPFLGSLGGTPLNAPIVGIGIMPAGDGYYLVGADGGVFSYGSAKFYGSTGNIHLNKPIVGMAVTPDGGGYWLVASDGGVFAFGDAQFYGSAGNITLNKPVVGMAAAPNGKGYWLVASDGGIFNYGPAAPFLGSTGNLTLNKPVVGIAATTTGQYYLVASDGGIFAFPSGPSGLPFYGSTGNLTLNKPIVGMTTVQGGYYESGSDGGIFAYPTGSGGLPFYGSTGNITLNKPIVGVAS